MDKICFNLVTSILEFGRVGSIGSHPVLYLFNLYHLPLKLCVPALLWADFDAGVVFTRVCIFSSASLVSRIVIF